MLIFGGFFWKKGILLLCKHSYIYDGTGEKTGKKYNAEIEGFLCPRHQISVAIV